MRHEVLNMKPVKTEPEFKPGQVVTHVWNRGKFLPLDVPLQASEVSCPMCGKFGGYRVNDPNIAGFVGWSCFEEECIASSSKVVYVRPRMTLENCGVPEEFLAANFDDMDQPTEVIEQLQEFCKTFRGFLLMPGHSGRGKTYASVCCMERYLRAKENCLFVNVAQLYVMWLSLKQNGQSELGLLGRYSECELLVLDDLGTRAPSEGFLDFIYLLINQRSGKTSLGTIISTNLGAQAIAEKLGDAILSRISSGLIVKFITGKDKRTHKF